MRHQIALKIGPVAFRIGSAWRAPLDALAKLYAGYPEPPQICDFTVRALAKPRPPTPLPARREGQGVGTSDVRRSRSSTAP